jgi:proteic killer suppression protein
VIKNFKCRETQKIWNGEVSRKIPNEIQAVARRKLRMIAAASLVETLRIPPANNLKKLAGKREGQYSIRINDQWRICFKWSDTQAYDVEIVDYH